MATLLHWQSKDAFRLLSSEEMVTRARLAIARAIPEYTMIVIWNTEEQKSESKHFNEKKAEEKTQERRSNMTGRQTEDLQSLSKKILERTALQECELADEYL